VTVSLREKRRRQTQIEIQEATLSLALQKGLEKTTTEEIAAAAGVSTRTFFNYFPNKEAAAIGRPPSFKQVDIEMLQNGNGALADDLKLFLDAHIQRLLAREDTLASVCKILLFSEKAMGILDGFLEGQRSQIAQCLEGRVKDRTVALILAGIAGNATESAIRLWEQNEEIALDDALDTVWEATIGAAGLLCAPGN